MRNLVQSGVLGSGSRNDKQINISTGSEDNDVDVWVTTMQPKLAMSSSWHLHAGKDKRRIWRRPAKLPIIHPPQTQLSAIVDATGDEEEARRILLQAFACTADVGVACECGDGYVCARKGRAVWIVHFV